jgi:hypothetical protein
LTFGQLAFGQVTFKKLAFSWLAFGRLAFGRLTFHHVTIFLANKGNRIKDGYIFIPSIAHNNPVVRGILKSN